MVASTRIRVVVLAMHPGGSIVSAIHVSVSIGATWIHPFTVVALRAVSAVVHVLVICTSGGIVCGAAVAIIVGRRAVCIIVVCGAIASAIRRRAVARITVPIACGAIVIYSAIACGIVCVPGSVVGVTSGTIGSTVGVVVGGVGHFVFIISGRIKRTVSLF